MSFNVDCCHLTLIAQIQIAMFALIKFMDTEYETRIVNETDIRAVRKSSQVKVKDKETWRLATIIARDGMFLRFQNKYCSVF